MRLLLLPVIAAAFAAFAIPASAGMGCTGHDSKDQTAEQPNPQPLPTPST